MPDSNKRNLQYFAEFSMEELYKPMDAWQVENKKRFLSVSVQKDCDKFCCIALTNPIEVVIVDRDNSNYRAKVHFGGHLATSSDDPFRKS